MRQTLAAALLLSTVSAPALSQTIYPIDRAQILTGAMFDLKVEFPGLAEPGKISVTVNGQDHAQALGRAATYVAREDDKDQSAVTLRDVVIDKPGRYVVKATDGVNTREVAWDVYETAQPRKARNVILFIGDGMSNAHRVAARILARGIQEGKYKGKLTLDDMPAMALVSTSGVDSVITDSANSASAYTTGHKSSTNALGVYADRTKSTTDDPKVETITSLAQRRLNMAVGVVTNTEIEDATPASMVAHTRRRAEYDVIVQQFLDQKPDVIMGGGAANFIPKSTAGSKRGDDQDYVERFKDAGYAVATTAGEMKAASAAGAKKLLGLFNLGNMDGVLDRKFLKVGSVKRYPEQPDLTEQVKSAIEVLSKNDNGFVLMVESGLIDKFTHALDMERAIYDTIMLDNAVKVAKDFADQKNDTLILVLADHTHPVGIVGVMHDDMDGPAPNVELRDRLGIYAEAGYPSYPAPDAEGYPNKVDVKDRLALFSASFPDYYETYRPKMDGPNNPTVAGKEKGTYAANEIYAKSPGAQLRPGNLPKDGNSDVHSAEDSLLNAYGPGSEMVKGSMDNTDVFKVMAHALALGTAK
ncbi:alkaline phosphatase [Alsobacter metallidurans]|uniref:Alkaline phosphatase n=1 Tax=Alsobacter metallidurans TaxID=340221 RepID=A0A917I6N2_9HYPH|nr:alkaline phosphatase [Alsobacter metallidurans]GGH16081.1 alkaline phosphatase [Alsobacter metallidurans]